MSGWELDIASVGWANLAIGAAALISSITGFGYALLAAPVLVLFLPPKIVVPVVLMSWMPLSLLLISESYAEIAWPKIGDWLIGALPGMILGVYGLAKIAEGPMRGGIGVMTLLAALVILLRPRRPIRREQPVSILVGLLSGAMAGASGVSGPPVVLFGLNQGWDHRVLRACLIAYFTVLHAMTIVVMGNFGMINSQTLGLAVWVLPGLAMGYLLGFRLRDRINSTFFRNLTLCLVGLAGFLSILRY